MAAKIYYFPIDIGEDEINESEHVWTDEEIIQGYEENSRFEEDEYYYNWLMRQGREQNEQENEVCFLKRLARKIFA